MHRRSFIIGIGIGIIIGVLLLELFTIGEKGQKQLNAIEQQINGGEASPSPSPTAASIDSEPAAPQTPESPAAPEAPASEEIDKTASPDQLTTPIVEPVETENIAMPDAVETPKMAAIFRVHPGDSITETAKRLEDSKLFSDSSEFVDYFKNNAVDIRAGFFYVEEQMELSDLRKLFTSQPLTEVEANEQITTKGLTLIQ